MPDWLYTLLHQVCFSFCIRDARLATKPFTLYDRGCSCSDETYVTSYACISWILLGYMLNHTESEHHISFGVNMYILYSLLLYFYLDYLHCIYVWCKHSLMLLFKLHRAGAITRHHLNVGGMQIILNWCCC